MIFASTRFRAAALALALAPVPALAQQFSESYQFLEAVNKGDGNKVMEFLNKPGTQIINSRSRENGETALHIIVRRGDAGYLRFFLSRQADPNIRDDRGMSPLLLAVNENFPEGVQILIEKKANVNLANSSGETPLIRAVQTRNLEMVRTLLAANADPDQADVIAGMSARDYARADTRSPQIAQLLADAPKRERRAVSGPRL